MHRVERMIEIEAPLERVFDLFSDFESFPRWMRRSDVAHPTRKALEVAKQIEHTLKRRFDLNHPFNSVHDKPQKKSCPSSVVSCPLFSSRKLQVEAATSK